MLKNLLLLVIISVVVYSCDNKTEIKKLSVNGIVVNKIKEETGCFGAIVFQNNNKLDTLKSLCYCSMEEQNVWDYVLPKDSIVKLTNTLKISIVRNGIRKDFIYPSCIQ